MLDEFCQDLATVQFYNTAASKNHSLAMLKCDAENCCMLIFIFDKLTINIFEQKYAVSQFHSV